jgi:hypothetical protein
MTGVPRSVLPTYITECDVVLCKVAPYVRDTYEVRVCLFMALKRGLRFVLSTRPGAQVEPSLAAALGQHGGAIIPNADDGFTVSVGTSDAEGRVADVWVLGHDEALLALRSAFEAQWLTEAFVPGMAFSGENLRRLIETLSRQRFTIRNVDDEDVRQCLIGMAEWAHRAGGAVFVQ